LFIENIEKMNWKLMLMVFTALLALAACGQGNKKTTKSAKTDTTSAKTKAEKPKADPLVAGKRVYNTYCLTCHGQKGDMGASGAHDLTKTKLSFAESVKVITEGRNLMTPHKFLGEEKIKAVAKYIETFKVN